MELSKLMGCCVKRPFIPSELFSGGLINGAWFDPSDMSTLYQDAAGTTPVTAVEQPVGLVLDKSQGLMLGPELVSNGTFDTDTKWTKQTGWSISTGSARCDGSQVSTSLLYQDVLKLGKFYRIEFDVVITAGNMSVRTGAAGADSTVTTSGRKTQTSFCVGNTVLQIRANVGFVGSIDNISVRELYGNHATQSVTASRPVLSARYNLLTKTEDFSNAVWTKVAGGTGTAPSITNNYDIAPDGSQTAIRVQLNKGAGTTSSNLSAVYQSSSSVVSQSYSRLCYVKLTDGAKSCRVHFDDISSVGGTSVTITNTWTLINLSTTATDKARGFRVICRGGFNTTDTADFLIWHPQYVLTGYAGPYQRVNTATDYDTDERYFPKYLRFDGVDDYLTLGDVFDIGINGVSINTSVILFGSTKSPIAGKSRTAAEGGRYFLGTEPGLFLLVSHGSAPPVNIAYSQSIGESVVLSAKLGPHGNRSLSLYKNANLLSTVNTSLTTASYDTTNPFWIGAYPNSTGTTPAYAYLKGGIYGLIVTQSALTDAQRIACERYLGRKSGVQL